MKTRFRAGLVALLAAGAAGLIGCAGDVNTDGLSNDAKPTFKLYGVVRDAETQAPLVDANVSVFVNGAFKSKKTLADDTGTPANEAGLYTFDSLPFDSDIRVVVDYTKPEVKDAAGAVTSPAVKYATWTQVIREGEPVIGNGDQVVYQANTQVEQNVAMVKSDYTLTGTVWANGVAAAGATVVLDLRDSGFDTNLLTTTTGADGKFSFTGLPKPSANYGINFQGWVMPFDQDADGVVDFQTRGFNFFAVGNDPSNLNINLLNATPGLDAVFSNVQDGIAAPAEAITVVWNEVIGSDPLLTDVTLRNNNTGAVIATTWKVESGVQLVVTPVTPLAVSTEYNLAVSVAAPNGDRGFRTYNFFVPGAKDVLPITGLALQNAAFKANANTTALNLKWKSDANATSYKVYAKDSGVNTAWVQVASFAADQALTNQLQTVFLPAQFDTKQNDGVQTPFEAGTKVTFVVTGENEDGQESPLAGATTLEIADTTVPTFFFAGQDVTANNAGAAATKVKLSVNFSEYMNQTLKPTIVFADGVGSPAGMPDATTTTWTWNNDGTGGSFEFTVPATTNYSADTFVIDLTGMKDTSGNAIVDDAATAATNEAKIPGTGTIALF